MSRIAPASVSRSYTRRHSGLMYLFVPHSIASCAASENGDFSAPNTIAIAICAWPAVNASAASLGTPFSMASSIDCFIQFAAAAMMISLTTAIPVSYVMQSGFRSLELKKVAINVEAFDQKKQLTIDGISVSRREARPGEKVLLNVVLAGENGAETTRQVEYQVPIGAELGPLYFTVADANTANLADFRQILTTSPRSAGQLIATVNNLHPNTKAYVRVWRADPAFQLEGADLPDPPASVALILAGSQASLAGITQTRNSKVAEMQVDAGDMVVSGSKTIQVEIKE